MFKQNKNSTLVKYTEHKVTTNKTIHTRKHSNTQKLVRIIFTDPNATDSSSDDEPHQGSFKRRVKRYVHEIIFEHAPNRKRHPSRKNLRGVRRQPCTAENRDRSRRRRVLLGTFGTAEEAATMVYYDKAALKLKGDNVVKTETGKIDGQTDKVNVDCLSSPTSVLSFKDPFDGVAYGDVDVFGFAIDVPLCLTYVNMPGKCLDEYDIGEFDDLLDYCEGY